MATYLFDPIVQVLTSIYAVMCIYYNLPSHSSSPLQTEPHTCAAWTVWEYLGKHTQGAGELGPRCLYIQFDQVLTGPVVDGPF